MKRISSGIPGLDDTLDGGFPMPSVILVLGDAGSGKTTFVMQSLFHGAENNENGIYLTGISEEEAMIRKFMGTYSFYNDSAIKKGLIQFWDFGKAIRDKNPEKTLETIEFIVSRNKPTRIVVDPLPVSHALKSDSAYREYIFDFFTFLRKLDAISLIVAEKRKDDPAEILTYMADGIIELSYRPIDNPLRFKNILHIKKMRGTKHAKDFFSVSFTNDGMQIFKLIE